MSHKAWSVKVSWLMVPLNLGYTKIEGEKTRNKCREKKAQEEEEAEQQERHG